MKCLLLITLMLFQLLFVSESVLTLRDNNYLRSGPGSFYPLIEIIPRNVKIKILQKDKSWVKVQLPDDKVGWIAENCISQKGADSKLEKELIKYKTNSEVSRTTLTAAIKGLKGKAVDGSWGSNLDLLNTLSEKRIDPVSFNRFKTEVDNAQSANRNKVQFSELKIGQAEYDPDVDELKVGLGTAARLAGNVNTHSSVEDYANYICNLLISKSNMYDWEFRVMILNDSKINGYACPGGYIFLTLGAVKMCTDESELAYIIAHEAAHVISRHGLQEVSKRKVQIKSENAFDELDSESNTTPDSVELDLREMMEQAYERIVHERLLKYEVQADKIASILLANAGYDPFSSARVAQKLAAMYVSSRDIFDYQYASPNDARTRFDEINRFTDRHFSRNNPGASLTERFIKSTK